MKHKIEQLLGLLYSFGWVDKGVISLTVTRKTITAKSKGFFAVVVSNQISSASQHGWVMDEMHNDRKWVVATDLHHYVAFHQGIPMVEGVFSHTDVSLPLLLKKDSVESNESISYINNLLEQPIVPSIIDKCLTFINELRTSIGSEIAKKQAKSKCVPFLSNKEMEGIDDSSWKVIDLILEQKISALFSPTGVLELGGILRSHLISDPLIINSISNQFVGPVFARHLGFAYELSLAFHLQCLPISKVFTQNSLAEVGCKDSFMLGLMKSVKKKKQGIYYTPNDVVQFMVTEALTPLSQRVSILLKNVGTLPSDERVKVVLDTLKSVKKFSILDPSVGCGEFLVESLRLLACIYKDISVALNEIMCSENKPSISSLNYRKVKRAIKKISNFHFAAVENNIYGIDLDPRARRYCILNLASRCFHSSAADSLSFTEALSIIEDKIIVANTIFCAAPRTFNVNKNYSDENIPEVKEGLQVDPRIEEYFPKVFRGMSKGFSLIIGNPPYHKLSHQECQSYLAKGYLSTGTSDIYSLFIESMMDQLNPKVGAFCMIVPLSLAFSKRVRPLRNLVLGKKGLALKLHHFDNIPDTIFKAGKPESNNTNQANSQRATIFFMDFKSDEISIKSTDLMRWRSAERKKLFKNLHYADITDLCNEGGLPRIGNQELVNFIKNTQKTCFPLGDLINKSEKSTLFMPNTARYFIPAVLTPLLRPGEISFPISTDPKRFVAVAAINSNIFYWYWRAFGDGFHITKSLVKSFPIPVVWTGSLETEVIEAARNLLEAEAECKVFKKNASKISANVNFNKRPDLITVLDDLYLEALGEKSLNSLDFAKYKLSSYI